ncbi:MAG: cobaltochelatase subunit CobN [Synechococcaceae cyanobacterium]|nr:cobaltochelatase subunit CobN [Synechococcaceae cyanobacterium]
MHRLATVPGDPGAEGGPSFVEQTPAPVVLLSSADTDLVGIAGLLRDRPDRLGAELRALNLAVLSHPAVLDHYVRTCLRDTRVLLVRLLGGRGHWSYGLECLRDWACQGTGRRLLVLAGTADEDQTLASLGTESPQLCRALAACLREGGADNLGQVLDVLAALLQDRPPTLPIPQAAPDPQPHDWREEPGDRIGLIVYRAWRQAGDLNLVEATLAALRRRILAPRALWVSSLREAAVQRGVADLLERERVRLVLCTTSFASVRFEEAGLGAPLWDRLGVPVLQLLCSARSRAQWQASSIGLGPLDLSLQIALPELDGRLTTRVGAFKERQAISDQLNTALLTYRPDPERLDWIAQLSQAWVRLANRSAAERRLALMLVNYPTRDSRVANGVGLDTPASAALILGWLRQAGYNLGSAPLPQGGDALIQALLSGRTNDPESGHRAALDHLPLEQYERWYGGLPAAGRQRLEAQWGPPAADAGLEPGPNGRPAFAIRGLRYGHVALLLQPERGYDRDPAATFHSPDLPPTHAYLATYLWLRQEFAADVVVHLGKHGNLEWLPGKGVGLSDQCFPEWALGPMPHLYPFIVNDPGEGSQAKRRAQAVIIDHLTPPLGRAGLHGDLQRLEALLDEYWEASQLGGERCAQLRQELERQLNRLELPDGGGDLEQRLAAVDGYLCELKEAQIRLGLHTFGSLPPAGLLAELLLCLARAPQAGLPGFTQALARELGLELDPWAAAEEDQLAAGDRERLAALLAAGRLGAAAGAAATPALDSDVEPDAATAANRGEAGASRRPWRRVGDAVELLEAHALRLVSTELQLAMAAAPGPPRPGPPSLAGESRTGSAWPAVLQHLRQQLIPRLLDSAAAERQALLNGLAGGRIAAGPSGAPSRGRPELLPTGRNFYSVDLRGLPSEAAWDLGRRSAELLLELHLQDQGEDLRHLALSVWGTATMRNGGEDIAQALALMGVRPVWDGPTRRLVGIEAIPLAQLQRPRVDVTLRISGLFRDAFPQLVSWFDQACRLVAALQEPESHNPLAALARQEGHAARIYGSKPGAYGAGLQALIDSGQWERRQDLGEAYLSWSAWRYGAMPATANDPLVEPGADPQAIEAIPDRQGLEQRLRTVQVVLHNQDNREHDLLDSDDYYQFQGGLSAAIEAVRGERPALWFGDHSRAARPRLRRLEQELDKVLRSRLLNPRWIGAMGRHGYKGGFEMAASLDYLFAYDASTGRVPDWSYGALTDRWLGDAAVVDTLRQSNPWALRDMAERLLEAHHRGLWEGARPEQLEGLRDLVRLSDGWIEAR